MSNKLCRLSDRETSHCKTIQQKDSSLRAFLGEQTLMEPVEPAQWLRYLTRAKAIIGNINNDVSFVATLLIKGYLSERFGIADFDAAAKAQGASGIDIEAKTLEGQTIVGELKTTTPYQPGFGAQQKKTILKDIERLASTQADFRFMFVTDPDTYKTLCKNSYSSKMPGVEVVDLVSGECFLCPSSPAVHDA